MKKTSLLLLVILSMTLLPISGHAQSAGIEQTISRYLGSNVSIATTKGDFCMNTSNVVNFVDEATGKNGYLKVFQFDVPVKSKDFTDFVSAFDKAASEAYDVYTTNWSPIKSDLHYGYGAKLERSYYPGGRDLEACRRILLLRDKAEPRLRYCYGLIWNKTDDGKYSVLLFLVYGRDPQQVGEKTTKKTLPNISVGDVKNSLDFLQQFGNLRTAYIEAETEHYELIYRTGLVNKILSLFREKSSLLSQDERGACRFSLAEMKQYSTDRYLTHMIDLSMKCVIK